MKAIISLITLGVKDLKKSFEFYHKGLGFPLHNYKEDEGIAFFKLDGTWLSIYPKKVLADDAKVSASSSGFPGFTLAHNVGSEKEVDEVFAHALSVGAKEIKKPEKVFWGGYSGYFADPDGYLWEIAYNPFTDLT